MKKIISHYLNDIDEYLTDSTMYFFEDECILEVVRQLNGVVIGETVVIGGVEYYVDSIQSEPERLFTKVFLSAYDGGD